MRDFRHTIDYLLELNGILAGNVAEWERESDPHASNKPRLEFALARIAENEAAIAILRAPAAGPANAPGCPTTSRPETGPFPPPDASSPDCNERRAIATGFTKAAQEQGGAG